MRLSILLMVVLLAVFLTACEPAEEEREAAPSEGATLELTNPPDEQPTADATSEDQQPSGGGQAVMADSLQPADFSVGLELVIEGLVHPVNLAHANDGSGRLFVVDQVGQIWVITADGKMLDEPFLDISDRMVELEAGYDERGLLGLAFHPDYANNGRFFLYYSAPLRDGAPEGWNHTSHVSEFAVSADNLDVADPNSERILMQIDQPQSTHNGGQIRFGPDGYLYIPLGDGGSADDSAEGHVEDWYDANTGGNGQDTGENLLGSILRIDVDTGDPYGIPADNPLGDEQWAWGFRNPYSMHFDTGGENWLLVGDAGQNRWEEIDVVQAGGNYGWNVLEGTHCFNTDDPNSDREECPQTDPEGNPLMPPVIEFGNLNQTGGLGLAVVGGSIYRGSAVPELNGMYVFSSWSASWSATTGQLFVAQPGGLDGGLWQMYALPTTEDEMGLLDESVLAFGVGEDSEMYILTTSSIGPQGNSGNVYRITSANP